MRIKSLLLGSAAVLVSVAGAKAADAIVVEPEPVEYVRVCDAYGAGWFFIPGTETCLKLDGDVRVQYDVTHYHDDVADETSLHDANFRGRLNVRANNETEYGTLSSRIRFVGEGGAGTGTLPGEGHNDVLSLREGPGDGAVVIDTAYIKLGGFYVGYDDSAWHRYGDWGYYEARFDGLYIEQRGLFAEYTFDANGWTFSVGAEDGRETGEAGAPDVYAAVTYTTGGLYLAGVVVNDSSQGEIAWKVRGDYDFGNGLKFGAFYFADDGATDYVKGHTWGATARYAFSDTMALFAGYSAYTDLFFGSAANVAGDPDGSAENWTVGLAWDMVPGLRVQPEYSVTTFDTEDPVNGLVNNGVFSLRVERSF